MDKVQEALKVVLDSSVISFTASNIPISGNLDTKTIQKIIYVCSQVNFGDSKKEIDDILNLFVRVRCNLVHGKPIAYPVELNSLTHILRFIIIPLKVKVPTGVTFSTNFFYLNLNFLGYDSVINNTCDVDNIVVNFKI